MDISLICEGRVFSIRNPKKTAVEHSQNKRPQSGYICTVCVSCSSCNTRSTSFDGTGSLLNLDLAFAAEAHHKTFSKGSNGLVAVQKREIHTSFGSIHIFRVPHLRTEAARRF